MVDILIFTLAALALFVCGYIVGYLNKGITIVHKNDLPAPKEYNESLIDELPVEVRSYYDQNR